VTGNGDGGVTVENLLDRIRAEVAHRRGVQPAAPPLHGVALEPDFQHLQVLLSQARRVADVGTAVPPFGTFGPVRRVLARGVTRTLYFFLQVISVDQRVFNGLILKLLHSLSAGLHRGETELNARLDHLAGLLADNQARLGRLAADTVASATQVEAERARSERARDLELAGLRAGLETLRQCLAGFEDASPGGTLAASYPPETLAALYVAFEDRFRGDRASIAQRVREHLPVVQAAGAGTAERPILDLGCGRGEWLEVLSEAGLCARGVDTNLLMVQQCRARGLDVAGADALDHLRALPDASCGAVTAVHLVEHLPFHDLLALLDETARVLAPGGVAIFETPNPYNLLVGACTFHTDPTHRQPLAPDVLQFLAETRGLTRVEVRALYRSPAVPTFSADTPALLRRLEPALTAPEDIAVVGFRS
jgi:SAM-dependent methyltransferase